MSIQARILLVDDESAIEGALSNIKNEAPELVVSDVLMPKVNGYELLRSLWGDDNWILIILLTQVGEAFERVMALDEGVDDVIIYTSNPSKLVARIRAVLRRARPRKPPHSTPGRLRMAI